MCNESEAEFALIVLWSGLRLQHERVKAARQTENLEGALALEKKQSTEEQNHKQGLKVHSEALLAVS